MAEHMTPANPFTGDLARRIGVTLAALCVYRCGTYIPVPGIDGSTLAQLYRTGTGLAGSEAISRLSIFALGVMPYVGACVLLHVAAALYAPLDELRRSGRSGWVQFNQYVRYSAAGLAALQAYGLATGIEAVGSNLVPQPGIVFRVSTVVTLVAGTMFLVWLGEQVFARGLCDGVWLLFAAPYIASLPTNVTALIEVTRTGAAPSWFLPAGAALVAALVALVVSVELAHRRLPAIAAAPAPATSADVVPAASFRLDNTGILAPVAASAVLLLFVAVGSQSAGFVPAWVTSLLGALAPGRPLYVPLYGLLIVLFVFFFTAMLIDPRGRPAGTVGRNNTSLQAIEHDAVLARLTLIAAVYLAVLCTVPELLSMVTGFPLHLGGTSLLVVVLVALNVLGRVRTPCAYPGGIA
jgi:preprotein translocase subunit SecY